MEILIKKFPDGRVAAHAINELGVATPLATDDFPAIDGVRRERLSDIIGKAASDALVAAETERKRREDMEEKETERDQSKQAVLATETARANAAEARLAAVTRQRDDVVLALSGVAAERDALATEKEAAQIAAFAAPVPRKKFLGIF